MISTLTHDAFLRACHEDKKMQWLVERTDVASKREYLAHLARKAGGGEFQVFMATAELKDRWMAGGHTFIDAADVHRLAGQVDGFNLRPVGINIYVVLVEGRLENYGDVYQGGEYVTGFGDFTLNEITDLAGSYLPR